MSGLIIMTISLVTVLAYLVWRTLPLLKELNVTGEQEPDAS